MDADVAAVESAGPETARTLRFHGRNVVLGKAELEIFTGKILGWGVILLVVLEGGVTAALLLLFGRVRDLVEMPAICDCCDRYFGCISVKFVFTTAVFICAR